MIEPLIDQEGMKLMKLFCKPWLLLFSLACSTLLPLSTIAQQGPQPLLSPRDSTEVVMSGKRIKIDYGRPSMRGRKIMGELVPYNRWWRTGANEATSFVTEADLEMGGVSIPRGSYTLYTLPSETQWKLIVNKQTGQWGTIYKAELDLARLNLQKRLLRRPVEKLTITLKKNDNGAGVLRIEWERTSLWIPFAAKKESAPNSQSR